MDPAVVEVFQRLDSISTPEQEIKANPEQKKFRKKLQETFMQQAEAVRLLTSVVPCALLRVFTSPPSAAAFVASVCFLFR
jgi:hypothetical protein